MDVRRVVEDVVAANGGVDVGEIIEDENEDGLLITINGEVTNIAVETLMVDEEIEGVREGFLERVVPEPVVGVFDVLSEDCKLFGVIFIIAVEDGKVEGLIDPF